MKNLKSLKGVKALNKNEQQSIKGEISCSGPAAVGCYRGQWVMICGGSIIVLGNYCK